MRWRWKRLRKTLPFIPIVGIPLTLYFHAKYEDTGIECPGIGISTALLQGVVIAVVLIIFLLPRWFGA